MGIVARVTVTTIVAVVMAALATIPIAFISGVTEDDVWLSTLYLIFVGGSTHFAPLAVFGFVHDICFTLLATKHKMKESWYSHLGVGLAEIIIAVIVANVFDRLTRGQPLSLGVWVLNLSENSFFILATPFLIAALYMLRRRGGMLGNLHGVSAKPQEE